MTSKYLIASTTTPAPFAFTLTNVLYTAAFTFDQSSGDWTNTGGGVITYNGLPRAFSGRVRIRQTSSTAAWAPRINIFVNGIFAYYTTVVYNNNSSMNSYPAILCANPSAGPQSVIMPFINLFPGDALTFYIYNQDTVQSNTGTSSNFQITINLISF